MAIARSGGVNELLAAGAILSGVYFGDRCSPTASSANLIAALTKTDLYGNVGQMFRTALIPTVVCIAAYCFLSFNNPLYISNAGYLAEIKKDFVISWWALLPVAVMFCFPLMRIRVKYALIVSSATACLIACTVQGESAAELLHTAVFGYYPQDAVMGDIWNGGGLVRWPASS
ncbi:Na+/H+ antiporter NhaC family protein [Cloacibacillus porcorum]|uniref:Na+/H+ antiporter NhaC family protein n=1 Tax=Cloacibacillus porcorum TaxID=1197717 RepID=UPI0023F0F436|nr:Na+/H+ antiporter NhaC family protein [Cloacibacillus porcorum]